MSSVVTRLKDCANGIGSFKTERGDFGLCEDAIDEIFSRDALIKELVGALEFYGDETAYDTQYERLPCDCCTDIYEPINDDRGAKARAAITRANEAGYGAQERNGDES